MILLVSGDREKSLVFLIISLAFIEFIRGALIISYLPTLAATDARIPVTIVGLAITFHFISDATTNLFIGYIMKRVGTSLVVHMSFLISIIAIIMVVFMKGYWFIILGSLLLGIGICPIWLVVLAKVKENDRGKKMGIVYFGWLLGLGSGVIFMNYILQYNYGLTYWLMPFIILIAWLFYIFSNHGNNVRHRNTIKRQYFVTLKLLKNSKIVFPGIIMQSVAMGMLIPILPSFMLKELDLTQSQYSLLMLIGGGIAILAIVPMGKVIDKTNKKLSFIIGLSILGVLLHLLTLKPDFFYVIVAVALIGLFYALLLPSWNSFLAEHIPTTIKEGGWGVFSSVQGIGVMVGPALGSLFAFQDKSSTTLTASAILLILSAALYCIYFLHRAWSQSPALLKR
ncbi:MFS transporter [Bacillaceae bacterium S4-13-58]